jgi:hypothetical protein
MTGGQQYVFGKEAGCEIHGEGTAEAILLKSNQNEKMDGGRTRGEVQILSKEGK